MKNKYYGILICLISTILWGISGNVVEYLLSISDISVLNIVAIRLFFSGIILILYGIFKSSKKIYIELYKDKKAILDILIYALIGILGLQYSFYITIKLTNAAFTTLIQFFTAIIVLIYSSISNKKMPKFVEIFLTTLAVYSMFLLITNGSIYSLSVPINGILWGLVSVFTFAFYIIYIKRLFKYPTTVIIGLGMFFASFFLIPFMNFENLFNSINTKVLFLLSFSVLFGTVIPFYLFSESSRYISEKLISVLSAFEPLSALLVGIIFLNTSFGIYQLIGSILLIGSISILSIIES